MNQYLITTKAAVESCPRCHQPTLTGWAEGLHTRVDPTPANETAARSAGVDTYTMRGGALHWRDPTTSYPPTTTPILATHDCPASRQGALW